MQWVVNSSRFSCTVEGNLYLVIFLQFSYYNSQSSHNFYISSRIYKQKNTGNIFIIISKFHQTLVCDQLFCSQRTFVHFSYCSCLDKDRRSF